MPRRKKSQATVALLVGCLMLCGSSVTGASCPAGWHFMESFSKCYFFSNEQSNQADAKDKCDQREATLATINNQEVNDFIEDKMVDGHDYWIGLVTEDRLNGNAWYWLDGSSSSFRNWASNEPTKDSNCSRIIESGEWRDIKCKREYYFICQKDAQEESLSTRESTTSTTTHKTTATTTTTRAPTTTTTTSSPTTTPESVTSASTKRSTTTRSSKSTPSSLSPTTTTIQPGTASSRAPPGGQRTTEPSKGDLTITTSSDDVTQTAGSHGNDSTRKALVAVLVVLVLLVLLGIIIILFELVWLYRNGDPKVEGYGRRLLRSARARRGAFRRRRGEMKTLPEPSLCD